MRGKRGKGGGCADAPVIPAIGDAAQVGDLVEKHDRPQIAELFGDPEADIRCPRNQGRIGVIGVPVGQFIRGRGARGRRGLSAPVRLRRPPRGFRAIWKFEVAQVGGHGGGLGGFGGADDWGVTGAAAQVAGELRVVIRGPVEMVGGHGDGKARRAKAALAAVIVDHGLLHGMQAAIRRGKPFDGGDGFAVDLGQEQDAAVQGAVTLIVADHNGTGAAIAFVAAFLGAGQMSGFA